MRQKIDTCQKSLLFVKDILPETFFIVRKISHKKDASAKQSRRHVYCPRREKFRRGPCVVENQSHVVSFGDDANRRLLEERSASAFSKRIVVIIIGRIVRESTKKKQPTTANAGRVRGNEDGSVRENSQAARDAKG